MKKLSFLLFISLFVNLFNALAEGENENAANKGSIAGRVVDADHLPLPGAAVVIETLKKGAVTDANGFYRIVALDAGQYEVKVSYIGFKELKKSLSVSVGKTSQLNFEMNPGIDIEEVVVNGALQGQSKALNQQKSSMNITNIISADQVTRFPDANVGDALKRIPGINVQYDQGEARFGNIRGTSPEYNSVTVNGDRIPSAEAETRSIQLDLIPSDMVQAIEVNKVVTPDMDADAIGGSVNLVTKSSPYKRRISGTLGSGYNFLSDKADANLSLVYGDRFLNDKLGMVLSGSYQNIQLGSDNIEGEWENEDGEIFMSDFQIRTYNVQRERQSYSAAFDYTFNPNHKIDFKGIYNHRKDWENRFRLRYDGIEQEDGTWIAEMRRESKGGVEDNKYARLEDQKAMNFSLNGEHHFGAVELNWKGSYAKASEERPNERYITYRYKDAEISPDLSNTEKPYFTILTNDAKDLNSEWSFKEMTEEYQYTDDIDKRFKVDLAFPWLEGDFKNRIKAGFSYKGKEKKRDNEFYEYEPEDEDAFNALAFANMTDKTKDDFEPGKKYNAGNFISKEFLGDQNLNSGFEKTEVPGELAGNFDAKEDVWASYLRFDQSLGANLDITLGVRIEATSLEYTGRELKVDEEGEESLLVTPTETDDYINVLPSLIGKYSLGENTKLKFAWTNTIARPRYYDLVPHVEINLEDMEAEIGNPELEPTHSMNFDLMFEHYFSSIGQISAGVFYKDITNFIVTQESRDYTYEGTVYDKFYQPLNAGDADLWGLEFAFQRQFDFLPGLLKQTGFYATYTYNHSKVKNFNLEGREDEEMSLPGTPENSFNASLYYEGEKFTLRASFNYADAFIDEVGDDVFYDRWYDKVTYMDMNANYSITKNLNLFFEVNNLLNQPLRYYQGASDYLMQEEFYNRKIFFGVKFDF
ncbi:TonB-dependent receptor [uncultured Draconibacterium sp.]|uniref:TonB-dependent receptor n=1 Tax=uncultured Draconibacterium sp. TaxID=1573823 RepID=UPI0025E4C93B|nr:TonB-dependent receptor [uncultured Draconibacterium sp.]